MNKSLIEQVIDEERDITYTFTATYGFLNSLESKGFQLGLFYSRLSKGNVNLEEIKKALQCSLIKINDVELSFKSSEKHVIDIIERFGILEVNALIYDLLTRAMIGDIKKQEATQISRKAQMKKLMEMLFPNSVSAVSWKAGLLWVATSMIFGTLGGMSTMLFTMFGN